MVGILGGPLLRGKLTKGDGKSAGHMESFRQFTKVLRLHGNLTKADGMSPRRTES